jgi:hypothetical protein
LWVNRARLKRREERGTRADDFKERIGGNSEVLYLISRAKIQNTKGNRAMAQVAGKLPLARALRM